jgi:outer membrane receptor protein involved in Fe transport
VGIAGLMQFGKQKWDNPTDPRVIAGDFWGLTGTSGGGNRDSWAIGAEARLPITSMLTADISGRYDKYKNDGGGSDDRATYKAGLEFRPIDSLLFRGSYATAFRAPDLGYTFAGQSGFFTSVTDYYKCAKYDPNSDLPDCQFNPTQIQGEQRGNLDLKSITAKSSGLGAVWSPNENFNVKVDYYNIKIDNEVLYQSLDRLFQEEAACRLGQLSPSSPTCVQAFAAIQRGSASAQIPEQITGVTVHPINIANEKVSGIVASVGYRWDAGRYGDFTFNGDYNVTMDHKYRQYPDDPEIDLLREPFYSSEFKTILSGSVTWEIGKWATTLYGIRYGATPNYKAQINESGYAVSGAGTVGPYMLYNGSLTYHATDDASISLAVNNLKNSAPPKDPTWTAYPYYNQFNYNPYGRSFFLEMEVRFGGTKSQ